MTCKINLLFTRHNVGGHFVDWSIKYVCGEAELPSAPNDNLADNRNWHHHESMKARGLDDFTQKIKCLQSESSKQFENLWGFPLPLADAVRSIHGLDISQSSHAQRNLAWEQIHHDHEQMFRWAQQTDLVPVILDYHALDLHSMIYNDRCVLDLKGRPLQDQYQRFDQLLDLFFPHSRDKFDQATVWDRREMLALLLPSQNECVPLQRFYNHQLPHLYYTTDDIWNNFPPVLQEICDVLNLNTYSDRFPIWEEIYQQWRTIHNPYFSRHLDRIIDAIIHNKYLCLRRFGMDFWCEVLIQNQLIVNHNLNLRNWQLEKFPDNTQDIHQLLEPNIHTV